MRMTANVVIPVGQWTIDVGSDEGFRLRIPGIRFIPSTKTGQEFTSITLPQSQTDINETLVFGGARTFGHTTGSFVVVGQPLVTTIQLDYFERTGQDGIELSAATGQRAFNTTDFVQVSNGWNGWQVSTPNSNPPNNYNSLINSDVKDEMLNGSTSAYLRMPFAVEDPTQYDTLRLRVRYDDGFVAYLNGIKIADRNAPSSPVWDSVATQSRDDADAMEFEDIDLPVPPGVLLAGLNVLAIQGLNDAADSPDFLISAGLDGVQTLIQPGDKYMTTPTPGALNNTSNFNGVVADTKFSHDHGFYDAPFQLVLTTDTVGAQIRYTTNGAAPTASTGTVYNGPITINRTTTLRAGAFMTGLQASDVDTQTYIFLSDVLTQSANGAAPNVGGTQWPTGPVNGQILDYGMDPDIVNNVTWGPQLLGALKAIPTINIAVNVNDMFGTTTGIFVNPRSDGRAWERPASLELINPDGSEGFQINAGIRIRGGFSRDPNNPKHAFRLFFRDEYGAGKLEYPLFGNDPTAVQEFDKIDLRTFQNYSWSYQNDGGRGIFIRDIVSRDLQLQAGHVSSHGKDYHLYINGQYWGIYQTDERPEASNAEEYYGEVPGGYDTIKVESGNGAGYIVEATDGDLNAWRELWERSRTPSTAQSDIFTPTNVEIGDVFTLNVIGPNGNTASVSYTATLATTANVTVGLAAAWNASTNPLVATIAAAADAAVVKLTGKIIGMPTQVSSGTTDGGGNDTQALSRRTNLTPSSVEVGDIFLINARSADGSITGSVAYVATVNTPANVTAGLAAAWNASEHALHQGITAIDTGTSVVLVADDSSKPFYVTGATANGGVINAQQLIQTSNTIAAPPTNTFQRVQGNNPDGTRNPNYPILIDVDNLIDFMLIIYWSGNKDAPISNFLGNASPNNWFGTRPKDGSHGFRFIMHDSEHTLLAEDLNINRLGPSPSVGWSAGDLFEKSNPQWVFQKLWDNQEFQLKVADRVRKFFFDGGLLTPQNIQATMQRRKDEIDLAVIAESARWGDSKNPSSPYTKTNWLNAMNLSLNGFVNAVPQNRTSIVFNQLVQWNLYPRIPGSPTPTVFHAPNFNQYGGDFNNGFAVTMTNPNTGGAASGTIYYTLDGSDPRLYGGEVNPAAVAYTGSVPLTTSATVNARIRYQQGSNIYWSALTNAAFRANLSALHITEINYNPAPPPEGSPYIADDFEYIELQNTGAIPLQLNGIKFDEGITFEFDNMVLGPGERTLVVKNRAAFESRYGVGKPIAGEYIGVIGGVLSNGGEGIRLLGPVNETLITFEYRDGWYPITDGGGYSLVVRNPSASQRPSGTDPTQPLSREESWRPSNLTGGGPGDADPGINPEAIVINEAMSNSSGADGDWIELRNTTNAPINIGGWFLSNDALNLKKYQIPAGTTIPGGQYLVFYANTSFGNAANAGVETAFTLDEVNGADIYLTNNNGSDVAGFREHSDFGASPQDVSFGRHSYTVTELGIPRAETDFTEMVNPTPDAANIGPKVGPIVISEINYNPTAGGSEFIEIQNITEEPVKLWDEAAPNNRWKFLTGIDFTFPANTTIPGFGAIVLIPSTISIAAFRTQYNVPANVQVFQYTGSLDNAGEDLKLGKPLTPSGIVVPYQQIDKVKYGDSAPWPLQPDGSGPSLQRVQAVNYGNEPANWRAGPFNGNPGFVSAPQRPPIVDIGADASVTQGVPFNRSGSFSDINAEQTWTGTVNWGDGSPLQQVTLSGTKTFLLTHTYINVGLYTITMTVTDSHPEAGTDTMQVNVVAGANPVVNAGPDGSSVQGDNFTSSGSFTDPDVGQTWTATVDWGDGAGPVPLPLTPAKTFNLTHRYMAAGNYTVSVAVKDNANVIGTDTFVVNVVPNAIPIVNGGADEIVAQGGTFVRGGSFVDPNPNQTWTGTINWGDGTATAPLTLNADKTFNLSHAYNLPGTFTVTITVTDSIGGAGVDTVVITVPPNARLGTSGDDTYLIRLDPANAGMVQFFENRTIAQGPNYVVAYSALQDYTFNGVGGDDSLVIDMSNGNPIPGPAGVSFNGGANILGDLLRVIGTSGDDAVHFLSGIITIDGKMVEFASAERLQVDGGAGNDTMYMDESVSAHPVFNGGTGTDTIIVNAGSYRPAADFGLTTANLHMIVNSDALLAPNSSQTLASLTVNGTGRFLVPANGTRVINTAALQVSPQGFVDLNNNSLVLRGTPSTAAAQLAHITNLVRNGRAGGEWNGLGGIRSTTAANNELRSTNLAAILNNRGDDTVVTGTFGGATVGINDVLVKYTYNGDANLDGQVDGDDYARIDNGYASGATGYFNGDFNYSGGKPNSDDYFLIDKAYYDQSAPLAGGAAAPSSEGVEAPVVEEPVAQEPVAEAPVAQEPVAEAPVAEAPVVTTTTSGVVEPYKSASLTSLARTPDTKKKIRHHRRSVLDQLMPADVKTFIGRRRD
jgi:hypothetical protein